VAADRFADAAVRLAGLAGVMLGWRPDEFWCATPEELGTILATLAGADGIDAALLARAAMQPVDASILTRLQEQFPDD
jgi:hypothetical protein